MSDDREMRSGQNFADEPKDDDVEAHRKSGHSAADESPSEDDDDDVAAHMKAGHSAVDDGPSEDGDDVEAHMRSTK